MAPTTVSEYRSRIDRIIYLASLASDQQGIEPMRDALRTITYHRSPNAAENEPVNPADITALHELEGELKDYLINRDPLRSFTSESLESRLQGNTSAAARLDGNKRAFALTLLVSFATLILGFALAPGELPIFKRLILALPLYLGVSMTAIVWFYMSSLQNFKTGVRRAFLYLSLGWIAIGVLQAHYAVLLFFDLLQYPVFQYMGIAGLTTVWMLFMFLGFQKYAQLLGYNTRFASWKWVGGTSLALALFALLAPHPTPVAYEHFFRTTMVSVAPVIPLGIASTVLAFKIRRRITTAFATPMAILAWYLAAVTFNCIGGISTLFIVGTPTEVVVAAVVGSGSLPQILLLYTGYLFKKGK